jgi:hypothetical protein
MIAAKGTADEGRTLIAIGLEPENVRRMLAGEPIRMRPETHPVLEGMNLVIVITTSADLAEKVFGQAKES